MIYLDNQATSPTDPRVLQRMIDFLSVQAVGNPHSEHHAGRLASSSVELAREQVADLIGASPETVVFTSGATEANNIAILGVAQAAGRRGNHVVTCETEHKCVLECVRYLGDNGWQTTFLPVNPNGLVDPTRLEDSLTDRTALVSVMAANNEIGVLQPLAEIAAICRSRDIVFHSDGAQAAGKIAVDVARAGPDLMSLSGHKFYAPIGIGALYVSQDCPVRPEPLFKGGGQEQGLRSGTVAAHLAVAMGMAAQIAKVELADEAVRASTMRTLFLGILTNRLHSVIVNAAEAPRLPGNLNITFPGIDANLLIGALQPHVAISTNSACSSGVLRPSHVLLALGLTEASAESTIRVGFGRFNTVSEVSTAAEMICDAITRISANRAA